MKSVRKSILLLPGLILLACLLSAAGAGLPPEKKCYNEAGDQIPCFDSNYGQTQAAGGPTSQDSAPLAPVIAASQTQAPTASATEAPTSTAAPTETPVATWTQAQQTATPVPTSQEPPPGPSATQILIPIAMLGFAGLILLILVLLLFRWLARRRNVPPGPPN